MMGMFDTRKLELYPEVMEAENEESCASCGFPFDEGAKVYRIAELSLGYVYCSKNCAKKDIEQSTYKHDAINWPKENR
jgi:hypothetical protein